MPRFLLTPRWLALHLLLVVVVVAFTWLGSWQLSSYEEQRREQDRRSQQPVPVADLLPAGAALPGSSVDRNAVASGRYLPGAPLLVPGRLLDGVSGTYVLAPLQLDDGILLVLRGWVDDPADPAAASPPGEVTVTGVLRPDEDAGARVPLGRDLATGELPYVASAPAEAVLGTDELLDGWLLLTSEQPEPRPAPAAVPRAEVAADGGAGIWQNLSYAAQWWVFAVAALVFWAAFVRAALRERRVSAPVTEPADRAVSR